MSLIKDFSDFYFDKSVKLRRKIIGTILVIVLLFLLDWIAGFSIFFFAKQKAEAIIKTEQALSDTNLTPLMKYRLKQDLLILTYERNPTYSLRFYLSDGLSTKQATNTTITKSNGNNIQYNFWWLLLSSCGIYLLIFVVTLINPRTWINFDKSPKSIRGALLSLCFILIIGAVFWAIINALPVFYPISNKYIMNIIYQATFSILFAATPVLVNLARKNNGS